MKFLLMGADGANALLASGWRVPRKHIEEFASIPAVVDALAARSVEQQRLADVEQERCRAQGYAEGLAQAEAQAADNLAALTICVSDIRRDLESRVGELALAVVRRLVGELDPSELFPGFAARIVGSALTEQPLKVRARFEDLDMARRALARVGADLEVIADPGLALGEIVVETTRGRIRSSLSAQLTELESRLCSKERCHVG
jgi:type III secretion protein L